LSGWSLGIYPLIQYPLLFFSPIEIFNGLLSVGDYVFLFGVDMSPNGALDSPLYYDYVQVHVTAIPTLTPLPTQTPIPTPTPTPPTDDCEHVSQGNSTVKLVNSGNTMIEVYLGTAVSFGADLAPGECNLIGIQLPTSYTLETQVEITQCTPLAGGGCGALFGKTINVPLTLQKGQIKTITVGSNFFD
jgi:hypothetical protein